MMILAIIAGFFLSGLVVQKVYSLREKKKVINLHFKRYFSRKSLSHRWLEISPPDRLTSLGHSQLKEAQQKNP